MGENLSRLKFWVIKSMELHFEIPKHSQAFNTYNCIGGVDIKPWDNKRKGTSMVQPLCAEKAGYGEWYLQLTALSKD